eukprot:2130287-Ditylum_brightwellii.AAC.1
MFQWSITAMWQGEKVPAVGVIIPPVSPEDETTNEGVAKIYTSNLTLVGILDATSDEGAKGKDMKDLKLAP